MTASVVAVLLILSIIIVASYFTVFDSKQPSTRANMKDGTGPLVVWGYVSDSTSYPVAGAEVNVSVKNGGTLITYLVTSSDETGFYYVNFAYSQWTPGNTVVVVAKYGILTATNSTTADPSGDQQIDVRFSVEIPEFALLPTLIVVGCVILMLIRGRRSG